MKNCLIYTNCQGPGLLHYLEKVSEFKQTYQSQVFHNYAMIQKGLSCPLEQIRKADLFIYQPLSDEYEDLSSRAWIEQLPDHCQTISFPYEWDHYQFSFLKNDTRLYNRSLKSSWKYHYMKLLRKIYQDHTPSKFDAQKARFITQSIRKPIQAYHSLFRFM